jgi:hypothetical protein
VIASEHRMKGGSPHVGASAPGQRGPFGLRPYDLASTPGDPPSPWPTLAAWLADAGGAHPLWRWERHQDEEGVRAGLDALETILAAVDAAVRPASESRWRGKVRDFATLNNHGQLLDLRAELAVGAAIGPAVAQLALGDTSRPNPDYLLTLPSGRSAGVEVTAPSPPGVDELCERIELEVLEDFTATDLKLSFSRYPSRIRPQDADAVVAAAHTVADGSAAEAAVELPHDLVNGSPAMLPVSVRVQASPGEGSADWQVLAGVLTQAMESAEYAAFAAGATSAKAAQGRSLGGCPVLLAADMSRYGAAWMRRGPLWAQMLAASGHFTEGYPFAGIVVFRQSMDVPWVIEPGIGINPHLPDDQQAAVGELCEALGWPYA